MARVTRAPGAEDIFVAGPRRAEVQLCVRVRELALLLRGGGTAASSAASCARAGSPGPAAQRGPQDSEAEQRAGRSRQGLAAGAHGRTYDVHPARGRQLARGPAQVVSSSVKK